LVVPAKAGTHAAESILEPRTADILHNLRHLWSWVPIAVSLPSGAHSRDPLARPGRRWSSRPSRGICRPGSCIIMSLHKTEGAGNAGRLARPQPRTRKKAYQLVTAGSPKRSGIPCAMVLRLTPRSSRRSGFLVTLAGHDARHRRRLDVSVETTVARFPKFVRNLRPRLHELRKANGNRNFRFQSAYDFEVPSRNRGELWRNFKIGGTVPRGFAVRLACARQSQRKRPPHPAPNFQ
jgi:hypothetical protein